MTDHPKPPRPSDPSIRGAGQSRSEHEKVTVRRPQFDSEAAQRAAGLTRPRAPTNPEIVTNEELRRIEEERKNRMLSRHDGEISDLKGAMDALVVIARALRVDDQLPPKVTGKSLPPGPCASGAPDSAPAKPTKPTLDALEHKQTNNNAATYLTLATTIALIVLEVLRRIGVQ